MALTEAGVGELPEPGADAAARREDFAELSRRVRAGGLLARRGGYYAIKIPIVVGALGVLAVAVIVLGNSWWTLLAAVALGFVLAQVGFLGHDAGHRQVWGRRRANDTVGLMLTNLLSGFSFGWWQAKHSRHHAHTNAEGRDPDIEPGALVYTSEQADDCGRFGRWFAGLQAFMLVPLLFLEALNLHVASIRSLARRRDPGAVVEAVLLVLHAAIFFVAPFLVLSPTRAIAFVIVSQALFGFYLGASFLPNHVGMPTLADDDDLGFLRRQVQSSRNLSGPAVVGFLFGGLDSQIEHHLFPTMPRANLRRARVVVRAYCAERGIPYAEQSLLRAYRDVVVHLRTVGMGDADSAG
jgi:fatty acid desaturase